MKLRTNRLGSSKTMSAADRDGISCLLMGVRLTQQVTNDRQLSDINLGWPRLVTIVAVADQDRVSRTR